MTSLRHIDEWVGLLVVAALALFLGTVLEVGLLRDWFSPVATLRIVLPATGVSGLSDGADVEVLGIRAGVVRRVVIQPNQQMYAEAAIDKQAQAFIRRDSEAVIRRRFGVAGAAYIDISRGNGAMMDWKYAVIDATAEQAATEKIGPLIDALREKILPVFDDIRRTVAALSVIAERVEKGEGTVGRLISSDTLSRKVEAAVDSLQNEITGLDRVIDELYAAAKDAHAAANDAHAVVASAAANDAGVPATLRRLNTLLATLQSAAHDIAQATPRLPQIAQNVETASADLPALLTQIQVTAVELEKSLIQLRGSWLLGGGAASPPESRRVPAGNVQP
jgi:phospholipid/cholesterol/gamma-HCH transport system substrate-binding protein